MGEGVGDRSEVGHKWDMARFSSLSNFYVIVFGSGGRIRTDDLLITN